jgi:hypothetical protein
MQICPFYRVCQSVILQFIAESFVLERASLHFLGWRRTRKVFFRFEVCLWVKGQLAAKFNAGNCIYNLLKFPTTYRWDLSQPKRLCFRCGLFQIGSAAPSRWLKQFMPARETHRICS